MNNIKLEKQKEELEKIVECSTFDIDIIGNLMARIISECSGEKYCYKKSIIHSEYWDKESIYAKIFGDPDAYNANIIILESEISDDIYAWQLNRNCYDMTDINPGVIIMATRDLGKEFPKEITFYHMYKTLNDENKWEYKCQSLLRFGIYNDFIEQLIDFKINHGDLTTTKMNQLADEYIKEFKTNHKQKKLKK